MILDLAFGITPPDRREIVFAIKDPKQNKATGHGSLHAEHICVVSAKLHSFRNYWNLRCFQVSRRMR